MIGPVITVEAGEVLFVEGRRLLFETSARVMLPRSTRFLRQRDVVADDSEDSPEKAAYLAVQRAHLATPEEYRHRVRDALEALELLPDRVAAQLATRALTLNRTHHALLSLRHLIQAHDDEARETQLCA